MTARSWYSEDGWVKDYARLEKSMTPGELAEWLVENVGPDGREAVVSRGVFVEWYRPMTPQEIEEKERRSAATQKRTEDWERETYRRLREKFGGTA